MQKGERGYRREPPRSRGTRPSPAREAEIAAAAQQRAALRKKRHRRKLVAFYFTLVFVIVAAAVVLSLTVLFKITDVTVTGTSRYSEQQIVQASGIKAGDNLFLIHKTEAVEKIRRALPYLGTIQISRKLPTQVVISVGEEAVWGAAAYGSGYVIIGENGSALENTRTQPKDCTLLKGLNIKSAKPGSPLELNDAKRAEILKSVMAAVKASSLKITAADFSQPAKIVLTYDNRVAINLGMPTGLDYKLRFAKKLLQENIKGTEKGTLNMSVVSETNKAYFDPDYGISSSAAAKK